MTTPGNSERPPPLDSAAFSALYQRLRDATPWGPDDRRGGLNYLTPDRVLAAAAEVRLGRTVTLEAPIETQAAPDNPEPAMDEMTGTGDQADPAGLTFARDRLTMNVHGNADSHIDALCHVMYHARLYNGVPADTVTAHGAAELSIESGQQRDRGPRRAAGHPAAARRALARARGSRDRRRPGPGRRGPAGPGRRG